jgi:hypothetical protein
MSLIELPFADVPEEKIAPEGNYDLRIVNQEQGASKKSGRPMITCLIRIEGGAYAPMMHWLVLPTAADWDEERMTSERMVRGVRRFLEIFNIKWTPKGFDAEELDGATGRCLVTIEKDDEGNEHNRLRLPRAKND